jgi:dienelactone hydrolase
MSENLPPYRDLGPFADLVPLAVKANRLFPRVKPGKETSRRFLKALNFEPRDAVALDVRVEGRWKRDGVAGEALSWSVGYGPRTAAWLLRPAGAKGKLPGVQLLHDHGGYKYFGKEKVADGPRGELAELRDFRAEYYGGRAPANWLAAQGFAVLVHDTFLWGSRNFPAETMRVGNVDALDLLTAQTKQNAYPEIAAYNVLAGQHENLVEKYASVLGTTLGGIVHFEDRVASNYLVKRKDIRPGGVACVGLSGGGMRTVLMQGVCENIRAAVAAGAMTTYEGLLDAHVVKHTWMLYPPGFSRIGDWSDVAACRAPSPLMLQYATKDPLYSEQGMLDAHRRVTASYRKAKAQMNYEGCFYPRTHVFDVPMQEDAAVFLKKHMKGKPGGR